MAHRSMIRFRPPRMAMAFLVTAAIAHWFPGGRLRVSTPLPAMGLLLGLAGLSIMLRAWWLFKQAHVAICPTAETARLITHGIYRWTRNPMYLGIVFMMIGFAAGFGTLPFYAAAAAFFVVIDRVFCRFEEAKLAAGFGDEYATYARQVRRWL
jgi:protein-S-isoprenylcysteine O-methyltransferase Ste14